jgi:transposase InsO family protein
MDIIGPLPETRGGKNAILVVVDRMSKMVHICATTTAADGTAIAQLFLDHVFKIHGLPTRIVTDRGPQFKGQFMKELTRLLGVEQNLTSAYHPQSDGQTERVNRVVEEMIRHYINPAHDDWDEHLAAAEFAINNATHTSIGMSPLYLNYGQHPTTPLTPFTIPALTGKVPAAQQFHGKFFGRFGHG